MARISYFSLMALCAILSSAGTGQCTLLTTPDYYWDSENFGSGLFVLRISSDIWVDIIGSYSEGGTRYMFNDAPNWNWCQFNEQTGASIAFGANQIKADIIYGVWDHWDVAMVSNGTIKIYRNDLDGDLNLQQTITVPENRDANWIDLGKINSDPYPDMVASSGGTQIGDQYLYNYSDYGNFIPSAPDQTIYVATAIPQQVQLANVGSVTSGEDMIVAGGHWIMLYENLNAYGLFASGYSQLLSVDPNQNPVVDLDVADLDGDNDLDIVACSAYMVQVFVNNSTSGINFNGGQSFSLENIEQIALGEFNYDGFPDLAVATTTNITIYINEGGPFNISQNPPAWQYNNLGNDFGGSCDMNELQFADLLRTGALSLLFSARGSEGGAIGVFKDTSNPRMCPVKNFTVVNSMPGTHPHLRWLRSEELDADHYNVYRALMPDETPPTQNDFELLAIVNHPDTSYIDSTVTIHTEYDNYKIWYAVSAVDEADNESLWSTFIRFWGYYENGGYRSGASLGIADHMSLDLTVAPNPFNNETRISYKLEKASLVRLELLDMAGRVVFVLQKGWIEAGDHSVAFGSEHLPSGIYFARLSGNGQSVIKKLALLR